MRDRRGVVRAAGTASGVLMVVCLGLAAVGCSAASPGGGGYTPGRPGVTAPGSQPGGPGAGGGGDAGSDAGQGDSTGSDAGQDAGSGAASGSEGGQGGVYQDGDPGLSPVAPPPTDTGPTTLGPGVTGSPTPGPTSCGPTPTPDPSCPPSPEVWEPTVTPQAS